jgi:hypothetical protein
MSFATNLAACQALVEEIDIRMRDLIYAGDLKQQYRKGFHYLPLRCLVEELTQGRIIPERRLADLRMKLEYIRG